MRTALALPVGLVLAFAPGRASADNTPRVSVRLEYVRSSGGEACPAEPTTLRLEVAARMGYDPFEKTSAPERLAVVMVAKGRGFVARVERFNAAGETTWSETFPARPLQGDCEALMSPLASYLRASFLSFQGGPAAPPAVPLPEPAAPLPKPAAPAPSPLPSAPPGQPSKSPDPPDMPNPSRFTANRVAIVSYVVAGVFLGLGVAWTVDARNKETSARALSAQLTQTAGQNACSTPDGASPQRCAQIASAFQLQDTANGYRNASYAVAGVSAAVGVAANIMAVTLPPMIKGPSRPQLSIRPGGFAIQGSF